MADTTENREDHDVELGGVCSIPELPERVLDPSMDPFRAAAIRVVDRKWMNGTVLHYYFFDRDSDGEWVRFRDGSREWRAWAGAEDQRQAVRDAFQTWKDLGLGLEFNEVGDREDAEVRIGFMPGDGSWSYIGRDVVDHASDPDERTMNFGWSVTTAYGRDTALHEIGHTLGLPHEHQNPNAGLRWDEDAVLDYFGGPPNNWDDRKIRWNILRKLDRNDVQGSDSDPNSIMHYSFGRGLIQAPPEYRDGLRPAPGLSDLDEAWVAKFYPALDPEPEADPELVAFQAQAIEIGPGEQINLRIRPSVSRKYTIQTFGESDVVMVLYERMDGEPRFVAGDDDSGTDRNAKLRLRLLRGHDYVLRVRLYHRRRRGETAVFMW